MTSLIQTIQQTRIRNTNQSLPISSSPSPSHNDQPTLRRRLHYPSISGSPATEWAIHGSKSVSSMGQNAGCSIMRWWVMGWAWVLSMKFGFVQDIEMNEEEKHVLGFQSKGSLRHLLFKVKSEVRKLLRYDDMSLPQTFKYAN